MTTVAATELKNQFGKIIDLARREPVMVQNHGRDTVVIVDHEEFAHLRRLEDAYWGARADEALKSGLIGEERTAKLLSKYDLSDDPE